MPWDCFCPVCKEGVLGSMTDGDEMEEEMAQFKGKVIECDHCGTKFSFDTNEIIEKGFANETT